MSKSQVVMLLGHSLHAVPIYANHPGALTTRTVSGAEATPCNLCRQMFVNHRLAKVAAEKELQEAQARINVQQQLAAAQAQVGISYQQWHARRKV